MPTLTADERQYIRAMSGDDVTPYDVDDSLMQKLHDIGAQNACACAALTDRTVVQVLRVRVVKAARLIDETNEAGVQKSMSQKFAQLKALLTDWEARCGLTGGGVTVTAHDLGLDTPPSGLDTALYTRGWW